MNNNLFVCYSREDYEFVASFQLEFAQILKNIPNLNIDLKIDKSSSVIRLGDRYIDKIESAIENSSGSVIFISKNSASSEFINNIELPKILEVKRNNPNYVILPIFIDNVENISPDILSYQAINSKDTVLRNMPGDLKSLTYKNFTIGLVELFEEANFTDTDNQNQKKGEVLNGDPKKKIKGTRRNLIGFISIVLLGIAYTISSYSDGIDQEEANFAITSTTSTTSTTLDPINSSCDLLFEFYGDLAIIYDDVYVEIYNESVEIYNNYIEIYQTDEYLSLTSSEQKSYHEELGLYKFAGIMEKIEIEIIKFEAEGIGDVTEDHVELKRDLLKTQVVSLELMKNSVESITLYIKFVNNQESYFEEFERAKSDEERKQVSEKWFQIDDENTIAINSVADVEESLVNNLEKSLEDFLENAFEACPYEYADNNI